MIPQQQHSFTPESGANSQLDIPPDPPRHLPKVMLRNSARPCAKHRWGRYGHWNLAGQSASLLDVAASDLDIICVQEVSRNNPGWDTFDTDEFHWVTHRDPMHWRGVGIAISTDKFDSVLYKTATSRGMWIVARVVGIVRILIGSVHAHTGATNATYQAAVLEFMHRCPRKYRHLPLLLGVDANEVPKWDIAQEGDLCIGSCSANLEVLLRECLQNGIQPVSPHFSFRYAPTHFPRDEERSGRQIDLVLSRHISVEPITVDADRRLAIGSDHALLYADLFVAGGRPCVKWGNDSRARWVIKNPEQAPIVDEDDLVQIARTCTRPRSSQAYKDSPDTLQAIQEARATNSPTAWKRVHKLRRHGRKQWQSLRLQKILRGDWDLYRQLQNDKKRRRGWWGELLQDRTAQQLTRDVNDHLSAKMTDQSTGVKWDDKLDAILETIQKQSPFVPFELHHVHTELQQMRCRSAVGPDGIGVHLLRTLAEDDVLGGELLGLINHIVESQEIPRSWSHSYLALLAKIPVPKRPGDLRPICVSSAFNKLVNRLVCTRVLPIIRRGSRISCCGRGRQAADLVGCLSRIRDVTREWKLPLLLCKLDVAGAFDRVDRNKVASLLIERLQDRHLDNELLYMLLQLRTHTLHGKVPGGHEINLSPDIGIKQGAPESAELFGLVVDALLTDLVDCKQWGDLGTPFPELGIELLFYQDDVFMVETNLGKLCRRLNAVDRCLGRAGLCLAKEKTKIVANDHYVGARRASLRGQDFVVAERGECIKVLGLGFSLSVDQSEQAKEIVARTRDAAAAHSDILKAPGPWKCKISMMKTLVESQFNWIGGALYWHASDLHAMNVLQLHTCRSAFGLKRHTGETWVDWNSRTLRFLRVWLHNSQIPRWSTRVLSLQHMLHGHWARRVEVANDRPQVCPALKALNWKSTNWWRAQQALGDRTGARHPGRFYASNTERQLAETHGNLWVVEAQNRHNWANSRRKFLDDWDVRWTSGRRLSLRC